MKKSKLLKILATAFLSTSLLFSPVKAQKRQVPQPPNPNLCVRADYSIGTPLPNRDDLYLHVFWENTLIFHDRGFCSVYYDTMKIDFDKHDPNYIPQCIELMSLGNIPRTDLDTIYTIYEEYAKTLEKIESWRDVDSLPFLNQETKESARKRIRQLEQDLEKKQDKIIEFFMAHGDSIFAYQPKVYLFDFDRNGFFENSEIFIDTSRDGLNGNEIDYDEYSKQFKDTSPSKEDFY